MPIAKESAPDYPALRKEMVVKQLAARGIVSAAVLGAMRTIPREAFLPEHLRAFAYEDRPLPIGAKQTISQPYIVALMIDALALAGGEAALEIGTGSGYAAAILGTLAREVETLERIADLAAAAADRLARLGFASVHVHHGGERLSGEDLMHVARASDVVVTSYDIATRDIDELATIEWDRLVLDEAQDVKNPATKRARALRRLRARRTLAMTGTPIENRLDELWSIMDIVNPGLLGSRERFQRTFARPIEAHGDSQALARLRATVQPFILRRPKDGPEIVAMDREIAAITDLEGFTYLQQERKGVLLGVYERDPRHWKTEGADWEMPRTLKPLEMFRGRMIIPSGLDSQQAAGLDGEVGGDHPRACTAWMTGTQLTRRRFGS